MKKLYLECYSGISGDMTVGALLDLGADEKLLKEQLKSLPVEGYEVKISRVKKSGLDACDFCVVLDEEHENHDHDNAYLYGHEHGEKIHGHPHNHHEHEGGHGHPHSHEHRGLPEILDIIHGSGITEQAKKIACDIFQILAEAEAKAHGTTIEEVHFHEVGAVDSIVDIVAAAVCLDNLGITEVIVPGLYEGRGVIRCQHGLIPVPVPATVNIAQSYGITLHLTETEAELVTPTGAAIVAAVRTSTELPKKYRLIKTGLGAGKRDYGRASVLRAMIIKEAEETSDKVYSFEHPVIHAPYGAGGLTSDKVYKLESNIDDCTGEALGFVMERLFDAGAKDVHYIPVFMKKNRPAYQLNVICTEELLPEMEKIIFRETTTIGIRRVRMERTVLERSISSVKTSMGEVRIKVCSFEDKKRFYPEYESIALICRRTGMSCQEVWNRIQREVEEQDIL